MKILLGISIAANIALAVLLALALASHNSSAAAELSTQAPTALPLCERLPADLDFFIEGLILGNDPFYSPLTVRLLEPTLLQCLPEHSQEIEGALRQLRGHLVQLVAANVDEATKRSSHDQALQIFRDLRALFAVRL